MKTKTSVGYWALMFAAFLVYSSTGMLSKLASTYPPLSLPYLLCLGMEVTLLGLYAVMWQIVLKKLPLNVAFLCKSSTVVFSLLFAHFVFSEVITLNNLIGASIVLLGLIILAWKD